MKLNTSKKVFNSLQTLICVLIKQSAPIAPMSPIFSSNNKTCFTGMEADLVSNTTPVLGHTAYCTCTSH